MVGYLVGIQLGKKNLNLCFANCVPGPIKCRLSDLLCENLLCGSHRWLLMY